MHIPDEVPEQFPDPCGPKDLAKLFGCGTGTIYRYLREGAIIGERNERGHWVIARSELDRVVEAATSGHFPPDKRGLAKMLVELSPRSTLGRAYRKLLKAMKGDYRKLQRELSSFSRVFHRYSLFNRILINMQRPDARLLRGRKQWEELGYKVRKGVRAIRIYAPVLDEGEPPMAFTG